MKKFLVLVLSTLTFATAVSAQTFSEADKATATKIQNGNKDYNTIVSSFKQTKFISMLGEDIVSAGTLYYNKPEQLSMKYTDPAGDLMLINGEQCVMTAAGKERKTTVKASAKIRGMKNILSASLKGNLHEMEAEKITMTETPQFYIVTAMVDGKLNKSGISKVIVNYDKKNFVISSLRTEEADGSYTLYELNNPKVNAVIESGIF
jgi:outer membrane lipoprotein-sorting protein